MKTKDVGMRRGGIKVKHLTVDLNVPDVGGEILGQTPVCDCVSESVSEAYGPISPGGFLRHIRPVLVLS